MTSASEFVDFHITVCGIEELAGHGAVGVTHVLSILDPGFPDPDPDCMEFLASRGVMSLGTDSASMGPLPDLAEPTHYAGLKHGMIWTESGTGFGKLPVTGAFYCMADISRSRLHARDFAFKLLREKGVSVAAGSAFGDVAVGAVRISLASSDTDLREGVGRLAEFVHELD